LSPKAFLSACASTTTSPRRWGTGIAISTFVAYKDGAHEDEVPGAWASSSDAIVIGAVEIKRYSVPEPSPTTGTVAALLALAIFLRRRVTAHAARPQTGRDCR